MLSLRECRTMSHDNPVREIVSLFGGLTKMASALGHRSHSTIYGWVRAGKIPDWRDGELREAQRRLGIEIPTEIYMAAFLRPIEGSEAA
ncbi:carph-isopro domain-containing protein [Acetobacter senegalensis]|uniref:carph-isopro domain-containing protein n=1 Tax=Acetobacter senegalensis TaxID=446692 RepID=UPI00386EAA1F